MLLSQRLPLTQVGEEQRRRTAGLCLWPGQLQGGRPRPLATAVECQEKVDRAFTGTCEFIQRLGWREDPDVLPSLLRSPVRG